MDRATTFRALSLLFALILAVPAAPTQAQSRVPGLTVTLLGGASWDEDMEVSGANTELEAGWLTGVQLEHYVGSGLVGLRLAGTYTQRENTDATGKWSILGADLGMLIRPALFGATVRPYGLLTVGGTMYRSASGSPPFGDGAFGDDPVYRARATVGLGLDISFIPQLGLRIEGADQITFPSIGESPEADGLPTAHTAIALVGLQYRFGVSPERMRRPRPRAAPEPEPEAVEEPRQPEEPEPEPAPEAAPEPAPQPEPEPAPEPAAEAAIFTVQVGTFLTPGTARRWGARLERRGIPVWYLDRTLGGTDVSRLRAGAVSSEASARELAEIIRSSFGWDTTVEEIGPDEPVPADAVARTQELLDRR